MIAVLGDGAARAIGPVASEQSVLLHAPTPQQVQATQLSDFIRECERWHSRRFANYREFESWSIRESASFWSSMVQWSALRCEGELEPAISDPRCEHAQFFPRLRLNYVENLLAHGERNPGACALTAVHWDGTVQRWSHAALREQVVALSAGLRAQGFTAGDRVALLAHNNAGAVVATLAALALGCPVATVAPDLGGEALLARLEQIEPALLLTDLSARAAGMSAQRCERLVQMVRALPSLRAVVLLDQCAAPALARPLLHAAQLISAGARGMQPVWPRLPFNHPLFIMFTSGTTGAPKCLVHGAGGTLLEHLKEHRLHCDLSARDRLFYYTSTGWMMWHWQLSALASGVGLVLYDGSLESPDALWRIVDQERITVFGTGAAYLQLCERSATQLQELDFSALRAVLSTASILYPSEQAWVSTHVKKLPVQSISGGTDIVGCFLLGNPNLPAYSAECQCRSLALDVRAMGETHTCVAGVGELVCMNPFPSRPLGFLNDPSGSRFHAAYFASHPGCWTHGDLIEFTPQGTALIHGRSDGVLNVRGIRIGPAEIYRILRRVPEICESLAVEQTAPDEIGGSRLVLLVVLRDGRQLDDELGRLIKHELQACASPAHVPEVILAVPELPMTYSGKRSERSARDAINGLEAVNVHALRNPASLEPLRRFARQTHELCAGEARDTSHVSPPVREPQRECTLNIGQMTRIWEHVLGVTGLRPEDNFFDLGGNSLTALRLLNEVQPYCRFAPTFALLHDAPTVAGLLAAIGRARSEMLVELKRGGPVNLFLVHDGDGETLLYRNLAHYLPDRVSVFGIEPRRVPGVPLALSTVEDMARVYIGEMRKQQPVGPYLLGGLCAGGVIAYEMASQLRSAGVGVKLVVMIESARPHARKRSSLYQQRVRRFEQLLSDVREAQESPFGRVSMFLKAASTKVVSMVSWETRSRTRHLTVGLRFELLRRLLARDLPWPPLLPSLSVRDIYLRAHSRYHPRPLSDAAILLVRAHFGQGDDISYRQIYQDAAFGWRSVAPNLEIIDVRGGHSSMLQEPFVTSVVAALGPRMVSDGETSP